MVSGQSFEDHCCKSPEISSASGVALAAPEARPSKQFTGFRVEGLGVQGLGLHGLGFSGSGFRGLGFRV